jgi:hypothetical protein
VPCRDGDGDDDAVVIEIVATPAGGVLGAVDQAGRSVGFGALPGFSGRTTFTYKASAAGLETPLRTYTIDVADAPPAPAPPAPAPPAAAPATSPAGSTVAATTSRILSPVQNLWTFGRRSTRIVRLRVRNVPANATVQVRCSAPRRLGRRACPFRRRSARPRSAGATIDVRRMFGTKTTLRVEVAIEIRITAPNAVGKVVAYTIRAGKVPTSSTRCLAPGASRPSACPR